MEWDLGLEGVARLLIMAAVFSAFRLTTRGFCLSSSQQAPPIFSTAGLRTRRSRHPSRSTVSSVPMRRLRRLGPPTFFCITVSER